MQDIAVIVSGYDAKQSITLTKGDQTFAINSSATVKVAIIDTDRSSIILSAVTSLRTEAGADWANSLIVVEFPKELTAVIQEFGDALLEIQVDDGITLPWYVDAVILKGLVQ